MMREGTPALQIRHRDGEPWTVAATWPDGCAEDIKRFQNEAEANIWIAQSFLHWLEEVRGGSDEHSFASASPRFHL
jgi:hypothetical protein